MVVDKEESMTNKVEKRERAIGLLAAALDFKDPWQANDRARRAVIAIGEWLDLGPETQQLGELLGIGAEAGIGNVIVAIQNLQRDAKAAAKPAATTEPMARYSPEVRQIAAYLSLSPRAGLEDVLDAIRELRRAVRQTAVGGTSSLDDLPARLAAFLPECHGCRSPATRVAHGPPTEPGPFGHTFVNEIGGKGGKRHTTLMGQSIIPTPVKMREEWDCCDLHGMPASNFVTYTDLPQASALRLLAATKKGA